MMSIAIGILWIAWLIPALLYLFWKRGDWYLFIIPPVIVTIIAVCISFISQTLSIIVIVAIHVFLFVSFWHRMHK